MSRIPGPANGERGESLIELLVALTLLGLAVVAIVSGLATGVVLSDVHRKEATAGAEVRSFAEMIDKTVAGGGGGYVACATTGTYTSGYVPPAGYLSAVTAVAYWTGTTWSSTCSAPDTGLQKLSLKISSNDGRASETLDLIIRKPCGPAPQPACT
ncbi:hypothetical protein SAMN04515671_3430 [Nakamurella panacisegetis]|uniref:Prepilin-type N-terminal cleavage/methylation domain-containing protein n=1 Tax=Nakamurella panacisegetis TaxID=1090615 RepID=A0A1H0R771_9ACTN|nr:prepilin-type N-terminal cleavage/methylation domain-containing protein [Nakamurella panacisegetis]SDP25402.1 hypothetical protein SAMN04515671_3430 [Nakamurella panacisegetis]